MNDRDHYFSHQAKTNKKLRLSKGELTEDGIKLREVLKAQMFGPELTGQDTLPEAIEQQEENGR